ncbi:mevalonate kinase [Nocardia blacklockiae]|nr:mevalonate kinase [Nocardia blacklockiae]
MLAGRAGVPATGDSATGTGRAAAKLILFGEHVVVYGRPAISMPVPELAATATARRSKGPVVIESTHRAGQGLTSRFGDTAVSRVAVSAVCTHLRTRDRGLVLTVRSAIPPARGLGSSAAIAAAIIEAVADLGGRKLADDTLFTLIQESEALAHGKASGVDARTVIGSGGPLWFHDGAVRPLAVADGPHYRPVLVVADTGVAGSTRRAVATARRRLAALGAEGTELLDRVAILTAGAAEDLQHGRWTELGHAMTVNQGLLRRLGVSCPAIDTLVAAALDGGALGAKLSGGGLGGCIIALAADPDAVERALHTAGAPHCFRVPLHPVRE